MTTIQITDTFPPLLQIFCSLDAQDMPPSLDLPLCPSPGLYGFPGNQSILGLPLRVLRGTLDPSKSLQPIFPLLSGSHRSRPTPPASDHCDSPRTSSVQSHIEKSPPFHIRINPEQVLPLGEKPQAGSLPVSKIALFSGTSLFW